MTKSQVHPSNLILILVLAILVILGCKGSGKLSNNVENTKAFGRPVFPASEVCSYPKGSVLDKYGTFNQTWRKANFPSKEIEALNPNLLYSCSEQTIGITGTPNDIELEISYAALGSMAEGAYRVSVDYWITSNSSIPFKTDQKLREEILVPFCDDIAKKALKTSLSRSIVAKLINVERIGSPTGSIAQPTCEPLGQGFICVTENMSPSANLLGFKIFANEESYKSFQSGGT